MVRRRFITTLLGLLLLSFCAVACPQNSTPAQLNESGQVVVEGRATPYLIHHLPVSSFPQLPVSIQDRLTHRGCLIPQTYEAHQPENVVHASLEYHGSSDWAVLCSVDGTVSLLVFFSNSGGDPMVLASAPETERLQSHGSGNVLGFNWGIDPASPERVHEAQTGLPRRPPPPDHDALEDSTIDHRAVFHLYAKGRWTLVDLPE